MNVDISLADLFSGAADLIQQFGYNDGIHAGNEDWWTNYYFDPANGYTIDTALEKTYYGEDFDPTRALQRDFLDQQTLKAAFMAISDGMLRETGNEPVPAGDLVGLALASGDMIDWLGQQDQESIVTFLRSLAQRALDEQSEGQAAA